VTSIAASTALAQGGLKDPFPPILELGTLDGVTGVTLRGQDDRARVGFDVARAGDLNGDGIEDLIVSATGIAAGGDFAGAAFVVFGRSSGEPLPAMVDLGVPSPGVGPVLLGGEREGAGASVAGIGDINGDGVDDVAIGAAGASPSGRYLAGSVYVLFGRDTAASGPFPDTIHLIALDGDAGFRLDGADDGHRTGVDVAGAGDVNGDGVDDLLIGAYTAEPGTAYIVFGRSGGFPATIDLAGLAPGDGVRLLGRGDGGFGESLARLGDINGDGIGDIGVGAPSAASRRGECFVLFGRDAASPWPEQLAVADMTADDGFSLIGTETRHRLGREVNAAGDLNGDGSDDFVIGATFAGPERFVNLGGAYVVFGRTPSDPAFPTVYEVTNLNGQDGFVLYGPGQTSRLGDAAAGVGDVNSDGLDDLLVGAWNAERGLLEPGVAYVLYGRDVASSGPFPAALTTDDLDGDIGFWLPGSIEDARAAQAVAPAGDANGDGIADFVIGAAWVDRGALVQPGEAYIVYGRNPQACGPDLDGDGQATLFDFLLFQNLFEDGDLIADFDGDGTLTVFDFLAFQAAFDVGCS
jgi:glycosylphosphatidylinositol phospholipase D